MKIFNYIAGKTVLFGKKLLRGTASKFESSIFRESSLGKVQSSGVSSFGVGVDDSYRSIDKATENIKKAIALAKQKDDVVFDEIIPLPAKIAKVLKISTPATRFYGSLRTNKEALMKALGITSEEYNKLAALALRISKEESYYGLSKKYKMYNLAESTNIGARFISTIRSLVAGEGCLSLGMTRFKISKASAKEKALFKQFGITFEKNRSNILKPEQSAVATMIHLVYMGKEYPAYLKAVGELMPDLSSPAVQKSVSNARYILFNDKIRPQAIKALRTGDNLDPKFLQEAELSIVDIEDLRTYAKTVILSKNAFLAAKWNGRAIVPIGIKSKCAYANLLNIAAQKGYVSNIDKTSRVIY